MLGRRGIAVRTSLLLATAAFVTEVFIMVALDPYLIALPMLVGALLDAFLLVLVMYPALYLFVYRPLLQEIRNREKAEEALRAAHSKLELEVAERTSELARANAELRVEIDERKHAEKALSDSMERFRNLVETTSDWVWEVDENGAYTYASPKVRELLGYEPEEVLGKTPFDLMPAVEAQRVANVFGSFASEGKPLLSLENTNQHRDGHLVVLETSGVPIVGADGRFCGYRGIDRDVTERKRTERFREEYIQVVSHDLRNPLAIIQGQAEALQWVLERQGHEQTARRSAAAILTSARRMNAMIQDLVEAARIESGQLQVNAGPLDLPGFVLEYRNRALGGERIRVDAPEGLPKVLADPDRLERILANLLTNALKYAPQDTEVTVTLAQRGCEIVTAVSDHGPGILPEDLPHLFERYYRTRVGKERKEGLGLGLYITRGLVEAHSGHIWVESEVGVGSTFSFSLPVVQY